jgi:O-succinylbenzoic acid--CoA ligase
LKDLSMSPPHDNDAFWRSSECYVAKSPHRPGDADGLAEFAATSDETRSLLYFQTSGFAEVPKWAGFSREAFLHSACAVNQHLQVTAKDRWLMALPPFHPDSFSMMARCHKSGASYFRLDGKWDPRRFLDCCQQERITLTALFPTQIFDLRKECLQAPPDLRAVVVAGKGPPSRGAYGHDFSSFGWSLLLSYGMTEACSPIAMKPPDHLDAGHHPEALVVLSGWDLETDRDGRLYVRGTALPAGYATKRDWRKRKWIAEDVKLSMSPADKGHPLWLWEPIDPASGLVTRDCVQLWSRGPRNFLRFLGRSPSFVMVLDEFVDLSVLQPRLEGLAIRAGMGWGNAVVVPMQDDRMGSRLVLAGRASAVELEKLRIRFNNHVAGCEKLDRSIRVPELPRDERGKLDMVALKKLVLENGG